MWQPLSLPKAPTEAGKLLSELGAYYQDLVEYHQKALEQAIVCLSHVKALLAETEVIAIESLKVEEQTSSEQCKLPSRDQSKNLEGEENQGEISWGKSKSKELATLLLKVKKQSSTEINKKVSRIKKENNALKNSLIELIRLNRGKILHIHDIFQQLTLGTQNIELEDVRIMLVKGAVANLWASVPDSPGCWTLDLKTLSDVAIAESKSKLRENSIPAQTKTTIVSAPEKRRQYSSFSIAVIDCLKKNYPNICTNESIIQWLYPKQLKNLDKAKIKQAIDKILTKGEGNFCRRIALGEYIWNRAD